MATIAAQQIISSQRYVDMEIVGAKMQELKEQEALELAVWITGITNDDGQELFVLGDGHHRLCAAEMLELPVVFVQAEHPEHVTGEDLLEQAWIDSDWYYIATNSLVW